MNNRVLRELLEDVNTQKSIVAIRNLCSFMESSLVKNYNQNDFINELHLNLSEVYNSCIKLPKIELVIDSDRDGAEYRLPSPGLYQKIAEILKEYVDYSTTLDSTILGDKENHLQCWIVDDLADIHLDLKEVLLNLEEGTEESVQEALWDLKWGLGAHWGHHLIEALRHLHYIKYGQLLNHLN